MKPQAVYFFVALICSLVIAVPTTFCPSDERNIIITSQPPETNFISNNSAFLRAQSQLERGGGGVEEERSEAERALNLFFERLRSYVDTNSFNYSKFEEDDDILREKLSELSNTSKLSKDLLCQLHFVTKMFNIMKGSIEDLKHYKATATPASILLHKVIELKTRAIVLHNLQGSLDLEIEGYKDRVLRLHHSLLFWGIQFRSLFDVSSNLSKIFETHSQNAQEMLDSLDTSIPQPR